MTSRAYGPKGRREKGVEKVEEGNRRDLPQ